MNDVAKLNKSFILHLILFFVCILMITFGYYFSFGTVNRTDIHTGKVVGPQIVYDEFYNSETGVYEQSNEHEVLMLNLSDGYEYAVEYSNICRASWLIAPITKTVAYSTTNDFRLFTVMTVWFITGIIAIIVSIISMFLDFKQLFNKMPE